MGRHLRLIALVGVLVFLFGCTVRSISNSGYGAGTGQGAENPFYKGELTELDVLGIEPAQPVSEAEIARVLDRHQAIALRKGDNLLLLQSGALIPDDPMVRALSQYFTVTPFSGVPVSTIHTASTVPAARRAMPRRSALPRRGAVPRP
jgi:hypothetical protein